MLRAKSVRPRPHPRYRHVDAALASSGVHAVFTADDLNPGVHDPWYTIDGQGHSRHASATAGRGGGALRRRPGRARCRSRPLRRRGRSGARRRGLRAVAAVVDYVTARSRRTGACGLAGQRRRPDGRTPGGNARRDVRRRRTSSSTRRSTSRPTRRCRWRPAASSPNGRPPAASSRSGPPRRHPTRCGRSARVCSVSPSTGSG